MPADPERYPDGLIVKRPKPNAPDCVVGSISIKQAEFSAWLAARDTSSTRGWINLDIKVSSFGEDEEGNKKWYTQVFVPKTQRQEEGPSDALPF